MCRINANGGGELGPYETLGGPDTLGRPQILAKADMRIAAMYDQQLVTGDGELALGALLREKFAETQENIMQVPPPPCSHARGWAPPRPP